MREAYGLSRRLSTTTIGRASRAVICGADSWEDIEELGHTKKVWFERFLELPNGIAAHDTFARVFSSIDPKEFQQACIRWVEALRSVTTEIVATDGKTLPCQNRYSVPTAYANMAATTFAYADHVDIVIGQRKIAHHVRSFGRYQEEHQGEKT